MVHVGRTSSGTLVLVCNFIAKVIDDVVNGSHDIAPDGGVFKLETGEPAIPSLDAAKEAMAQFGREPFVRGGAHAGVWVRIPDGK